jgi:D-alanyl-D-alanine carboxypeptidase/D-alanyl-D-alanine-endopeptidase (penicillin-binding protein 4)
MQKNKEEAPMAVSYKMRIPFAVIMVWATVNITLPTAAAADAKPSSLQRAVSSLVGPMDSVMVSAPDGDTLVSINADQERVPASILKILTSLAAIELLGIEYRFKTEFYIDPDNNLIIKGYGDPLLVSERLGEIGARLAIKIHSVNHIVLDDTYFEQLIRIPGRGISSEPYDAPNGALCVNFNTVAFSRRNGRWVSDEPQTPLLPSVIPIIEASGRSSGRITLVAGQKEALAYTGALFQYFLDQCNITVNGAVKRGQVNPAADRLVWQYQSASNLSQAISKLMAFSNNFIANQMMLVLGAEANGPPASVEKGLTVLRRYYHTTLGLTSGKIVEASGISRQNRITAAAMMAIVSRFAPHHALMRHKGRQFYKTGHLKGIRTRAGYLKSRDGGLYRFVVMINTAGKTPHTIMRMMERELY